ncbi:DNA internalization-related competence protein ComEC/Rec2 [Methylomonas methanica]|uniref:DNA internalization-related competence protein ComEC/Rec2 n=1 Tax=Methylomonas methanica TaxID=421 RepID=UPI00130543BA|nr:DNA internalization-related competence protein ComEC/Rec2 [Methylomonas methanica]
MQGIGLFYAGKGVTVTVLIFIAGVAWVQQWTRLPTAMEGVLLLGLALLLAYRRYWHLCLLVTGAIWASAYGAWCLTDRLADELQGKDLAVQGYIVSIPKQTENRTGFDFKLTNTVPGVPSKLRLNWYYPSQPIKAGQAWEMTVRLKKPHGRSNPGSFDYEAWLFANRIGATGYVRSKPEPRPIDATFSVNRYLALSRQAVSDRLDNVLPDSGQLGVIKALTIGSQNLISRRQWEVFRLTGIVHLMVISGAHIGLVAAGIFLMVRWLWVRTGVLAVSPQNIAAVCAWLAALCYAALAGFSVPAQRAVLMLAVGLWALVLQRNIAVTRGLLIALLVVVVFDPLALLSHGFWLSFSAVALLFYVSAGRLGRAGYWRRVGKLHLSMAIGLSPLLLLFFQQISVAAPLANSVAVPLIGLLVMPLCLLAGGMLFCWPALAYYLLWLVERLLQCLGWFLQQLADWPLASLSLAAPPWYAVILATIGVMLLLAPKGMPCRYLGTFLLLPLFFVKIEKPGYGEFWFTLLDVGQGLAAVVQTERHALVFDTGARYSQQSDMGETVVLPFLRHRNVTTLDGLVISHGDNDHSGGAASVLAAMPVSALYSSVPEWAGRPGGLYCQAGQGWHWDGVDFKMLSPGTEPFGGENDNSCVLQISNATHRLLLTGDIQQSAEQWLVAQYGPALASSVLVAPHHGSKTSSSAGFLRQVQPEWVLIPAGYKNRFGFPHATVMRRYEALHITSFSSAEAGAISLKTNGADMKVELARKRFKRYWMD